MKKLGKLTIFLIPVGIAVNIVGGQIAILLKLPIWLDAIGTILIAAICGLVPGLIVAGITQLINAISLPTILPYMIVGFAMAVVSAVFSKRGFFDTFKMSLLLGLIVAVVTTAIAVPMDVIIFGGFVGTGNSVIAAGLMAMGLSVPLAVTISSFTFGLIDKVLSVLVCYFIIKSMPTHFLAKLPMSEDLLKRK
jgi:energy-coupling factor transport system substrate-specific component